MMWRDAHDIPIVLRDVIAQDAVPLHAASALFEALLAAFALPAVKRVFQAQRPE